ncbi:MAG: hypothetical protein ACYCZU_12830 [Devosia sp.]
MKLTWFAGTTIRIHIGGEILVADADYAPGFIDRHELVSGADRVFALAEDAANLPLIDPAKWRPRALPKVIDETAQHPDVVLHRIGEGAVLVDAAGEPAAVLVADGRQPPFGRWTDGAVVVLLGNGDAMVANGTALLDAARPKLIALAAGEPALDLAIEALREHLNGAALVSLEPGLALEV